LCDKHFKQDIESKFKRNVKKHKLFSKNDILVVAVSGGKDSLTALYLTRTLFPNDVHALAIDEGISGYRDKTIPYIRKFCEEWNIPLHTHSFSKEFGFTLDKFHEPNPCSICGVFRRSLINRKSREIGDVLITGHNLDDEVQSIIMNLMQGDLSRLSRTGWIAGNEKNDLFAPRVKPLRNISEKEITTYWFSNFPDIDMSECPYSTTALRQTVRNTINDFELDYPDSKRRILKWFDSKIINAPDSTVSRCERCGEPTKSEVCEACTILACYAKRKRRG
jgi:uncharacterized protein (TIGR00269 family)